MVARIKEAKLTLCSRISENPLPIGERVGVRGKAKIRLRCYKIGFMPGELMLRKTFYPLLALLLLNISPLLLYAGIGVKPTVTEIILSPGEREKGRFTVVNDGNEAIQVKVDLENWGTKREEAVPSWLEVKPREFELGPGEVRKVKYKIEVPQETTGELAAMVFFGSLAPAGGGVGIRTRFGVSIYVAIKGTEIVEANIEKLDVAKYGTEDSDNYGINFGVTVGNMGNVHIRPKGKVFIEDKEDSRIKEVDIFYGLPVLPQAKKTFAAIWKRGVLPPGEYKGKAIISYGDLYGLKDKISSYETLFSVNEQGEISVEGKEND